MLLGAYISLLTRTVRSSQAAAKRGKGSKNTTFVGVARFLGAADGGGGCEDGEEGRVGLLLPLWPLLFSCPWLLFTEEESKPPPSSSMDFPAVRAKTPPPSFPPLVLLIFVGEPDEENDEAGALTVEL